VGVRDADQRMSRERLVDAVDELQGRFWVGAEQLLELTQEFIELLREVFVVVVLVVVIVIMVVIVIVIVVVRHAAQGTGFGLERVDHFRPAAPSMFQRQIWPLGNGSTMARAMPALGTCRCCSLEAKLAQGICENCVRIHGPRVALLLARCQADADFASACLARLPEALRARFVAALSAKCLAPKRGPGLRYTRGRPISEASVSA